MIFRDQSSYLLGQLGRERVLCLLRPEANVGPKGQCADILVWLAGPVLKAGDLRNHLRHDRHQVGGGPLIVYSRRVRRESAKGGGADHVGAAHPLDESFYAVSHPPFSDEFDESLLLESPDMVVHLLPRHADPACQTRGRLGLSKFSENLEPKGMKGGRRRAAPVDDVYGCGHGHLRVPEANDYTPKI